MKIQTKVGNAVRRFRLAAALAIALAGVTGVLAVDAAAGAQVDAVVDSDSEPVPMACVAPRPCCEFDEQGRCVQYMVCFVGHWVCP